MEEVMEEITDFMEEAIQEYAKKTNQEKPFLQRDFTALTVQREDAFRVRNRPGTYIELFAMGSGTVAWYLYHSAQEKKCFLIWRRYSTAHQRWTYGCRTDVHRLRCQ